MRLLQDSAIQPDTIFRSIKKLYLLDSKSTVWQDSTSLEFIPDQKHFDFSYHFHFTAHTDADLI